MTGMPHRRISFEEMTDAVNSQDLGYTLDIVTADSDALVFQYTLLRRMICRMTPTPTH